MLKTRYVAGFVVALAGLILGSQAFSAGGEDVEYTIIIKKVDVKPTKSDGAAWDVMDGKPDLFVRVQNLDVKDAKSFDTKTHDDVNSASFDQPSDVKFRVGQKIQFQVNDKDVAANDEIGTYNLTTTAKGVESGKLRMENFGQVIVLEVEFKKLSK
jgi:hypothetical protein